mgnify:CR=1 FL=1
MGGNKILVYKDELFSKIILYPNYISKIIAFTLPFFFFSCGNSTAIKNEILYEVSGVWSSSIEEFVVELNFYSERNKTLKLNGDLYNISIKKIDIENDIVSFYVTQNGKGFKEPMQENPIWSVREIWDNDGGFTIDLTTNKGKTFELDYFIREL